MNIYRANIIYTPSPDAFRILPGGYVCVREDGIIAGVYEQLPEQYRTAEVTDYGDRLLIPAFNDMHLHAPQYRNLGLAMDLELLDWLDNYTFPEESRFADIHYAERMYRRFVHDLWRHGTMRTRNVSTIALYMSCGCRVRCVVVSLPRCIPKQRACWRISLSKRAWGQR